MTFQEINVILGSAGSVLLIIGGGIKYLLMRVDEKNRQAAAEQQKARTELNERLHQEITDLRTVVNRRVYALEAYIQAMPGVQLPETPGWPPE